MTGLGAPLFDGRTASVHAWEAGAEGAPRVVKLYRCAVPPELVEGERNHLRIARAAGLRVPDVGEAVEVGRRRGFVQARIDGPTLQETLGPGVDLEAAARQLGRLQGQILACRGDESLRDQRQVLHGRIEACAALDADERRVLLGRLAAMPTGDRLCHGDFHPRNVILSEAGPVLIDWVDATRGRPAADVARSLVLFRGSAAIGAPSEAVRAAMQLFHDSYLAAVLAATGADAAEIEAWVPLLAAARLGDGIHEQADWLLALARRGMAG